MLRAKQFTRQIKKNTTALLITSAILSACGGGGGSSGRGVTADTLPDDFAPAESISGVLVGETANFEAFSVSGIDTEVSVSITDGGTFSVDGGTTFVSSANVSDGDEIIVQVEAADTFSTDTDVTLTVGTGTGVFTVVSEAEDTSPEAFDLGDAVVVNEAEATGESELITIEGINTDTTISITDGEYRIGANGVYTSEEGTIASGQMVQVRATGALTAPADTTATLTIGDVSDTFVVSTVDDVAPEAEVIFPTPATLTDGTTVTLRGKASDNFGPVARIRVTVTTDDGATEVDSDIIEAADTDDFEETWSVNVNLGIEALNTISIEAIDATGNVQTEPTVITLLQAEDALNTNFPEGNDVFISEVTFGGAVLDESNARMLVRSNVSSEDIIAVDLNTGARTLFLDNPNSIGALGGIHLLPETNELIVAEINDGIIRRSPLDAPELTLLTDPTFEGVGGNLVFPSGLRFDAISGSLFVADIDSQIVSVDPVTGAQEVISDNTANPDGPLLSTPTDLIVDQSNNSLLVVNTDLNNASSVGEVISVNISDGERSIVDVQDNANFGRPFSIEWLVQDQVSLISSRSVVGESEPGQILKLDLAQNLLTIIAANDFPEGSANDVQAPQYLSVIEELELAFIVSAPGGTDGRASVLVLDATTGERVVLTRSIPLFLQ